MRYWLFQYHSVRVLGTSTERTWYQKWPVPNWIFPYFKILVKNYPILAFSIPFRTGYQYWLPVPKLPVPVRKMASTEREFPEYIFMISRSAAFCLNQNVILRINNEFMRLSYFIHLTYGKKLLSHMWIEPRSVRLRAVYYTPRPEY